MNIRIARSIVKTADIKASKLKVFDFVSNPINWPKWAIVNLRSVEQGNNGWFKMVTRNGTGELKLHLNQEMGIFDHTWKDPQASWTVPARVVANGDGATVMITIFQPQTMNDREFDIAMKEMDIEMIKLKEVLEEHN
jgi:hypothetical protein